MRVRQFGLALALVCGMTAAAQAQVGLFLDGLATRVSNARIDTGDFSFIGPNSTSTWLGGVAFGGYYTALKTDRLSVGGEIRDMVQRRSDGASLNSLLVGVRIAGEVERYRLRPYVEPAVGLGFSRPAHNNAHIKRLEYGVFAGVDHPISQHVDWRVLEVGYGSVQTENTQLYNGQFLYPNSTVLTVSTGLVFRIP